MDHLRQGFLSELTKLGYRSIPHHPMHLGIEDVPEDARRESFDRYIKGTSEADPMSRLTAYGKVPLITGGMTSVFGLPSAARGISKEIGRNREMARLKRLGIPTILRSHGRLAPLRALLAPLAVAAIPGALIGAGLGSLSRSSGKESISRAQRAMANPEERERQFQEAVRSQEAWNQDVDHEFYDSETDEGDRKYYIESSDMTPEQKADALQRLKERFAQGSQRRPS